LQRVIFISPKIQYFVISMRFFHMGLVWRKMGLLVALVGMPFTLIPVERIAFLLPKKASQIMQTQTALPALQEMDGLHPVIEGDTVRLFLNAESGFQSLPLLKKFTVAIYGDPSNPQIHIELADITPNPLPDLTAIELLMARCLTIIPISQTEQIAV
jgi:hypothetical protein